MIRRTLILTAMLVAAFASQALAVGKGASMLAIQFSSGTADLYDPSGAVPTGYISAYDHSEIGFGGEFWKMMSSDYAFAIAAGVGFFGETNEPGPGAAPGDPEREYSQSSFRLRLGGDRVVDVGSSAILYFGPGIEYWSGNAEFEGFGGPTVETENVTRLSLSARLGGVMTVGKSWGINGAVGGKIGKASAEDSGAEASWWPSSLEASMGILFLFGAN